MMEIKESYKDFIGERIEALITIVDKPNEKLRNTLASKVKWHLDRCGGGYNGLLCKFGSYKWIIKNGNPYLSAEVIQCEPNN